MAVRFNHLCSPNASHTFNTNMGELCFAYHSCWRGDICHVCGRPKYIQQPTSKETRPTMCLRPFYLCLFHFSLPLAKSKASDIRWIKLTKLWESIGHFTLIESLQHLNMIIEGIHLLKEEGYLADADNFSNDAGVVCAYHLDWISAKYWTCLMYHIRVEEYGKDSLRVAEVHELYLDPKLFLMVGEGPHMKFINVQA